MHSKDFESVEKITKIKLTCARIYQNGSDFGSVNELRQLLSESSSNIVKSVEQFVFSVFFPILKTISEASLSLRERDKQAVIDTFKVFFDKTKVDNINLFFNIYGFLLFEVYDVKNHRVQISISEEYKLSVLECVISLAKSLDHTVVASLYVKENAPKLSQMIFVALEIAKHEQFKFLRITAINCIMALARVLNDDDFSDLVVRNQIADVFFFFLPGVATQLKEIALVDEKYGHKIPSVGGFKGLGRLVALLMEDYKAADEKASGSFDLTKKKAMPWKSESEFERYLKESGRSLEWYQFTDKKLQPIIRDFSKLTYHSHVRVRLELANTAHLLIEHCFEAMPSSVSHLVDLVVVLSEDTEKDVAERSIQILENLSNNLPKNEFKNLLDNIEEGFYSVIIGIPRKFNEIDEKVQIVALNSLIGYIRLFGKHNLQRILHSSVHLQKLILTLVHICEFDKSEISLLEDYAVPDFELQDNFQASWKRFRHFKEEIIVQKICTICQLLAHFGASPVIADCLLDIITFESNQRNEAIFLLNEFIGGMALDDDNFFILKNISQTYIDPTNWYLPLSVGVDEEGYERNLSDIQNNILQVCLLVEGIGKIAVALKEKFQQVLMLKTLFLVLERAGSGHPLIRSSGSIALSGICTASGLTSIAELINQNIDYLSFHIGGKIQKDAGLNVFSVVIRFSSRENLQSAYDLIPLLLLQSQKGKNLNVYFQVFKMFIYAFHKFLDLKPMEETFKTKKQQLEEHEAFNVADIEPIENFSDDIMGKTAEDMYKEDMEKKQGQLLEEMYDTDVGQLEKPEPPLYVKYTVEILNTVLHHLPSKNQATKLLVLDILTKGVPILEKWEDHLLPIVHHIWSPLVDRFKEFDNPLIINYSFQLLAILAQLSKEFIRMRTSKEVLPSLLSILDKLASESYLRDRGSAYRYTQKYKLQVTILEKLALIVIRLDVKDEDFFKCMEIVFKYLSEKQPKLLQNAAVNFFSNLLRFDPEIMKSRFETICSQKTSSEFDKNIVFIQSIE